MPAQQNATVGQALKRALTSARKSQADLGRLLDVDPGQVSRWVNDKAVPHIDTVGRIEDELGVDLSAPFGNSTPEFELYVSAPITGLDHDRIGHHRDLVAKVAQAAKAHVNSLYWPGELVRARSDLGAADLITERNISALSRCSRPSTFSSSRSSDLLEH